MYILIGIVVKSGFQCSDIALVTSKRFLQVETIQIEVF